MSDIRGFVMGSPQKATDGGMAGIHATPYGDLYREAAMLGYGVTGRLFAAHFGTVTTPLAVPATVAIVLASPKAYIRIPDGTAIIPLTVNVNIESTGITTQGEYMIGIAQNDVGAGATSVAATSGLAPLPLNTAGPMTSNCTARQLDTDSSATAPTNLVELRRGSMPVSFTAGQDTTWDARRQFVFPVLRGPATLALWVGGNATAFFAQFQWLEVPEISVTA